MYNFSDKLIQGELYERIIDIRLKSLIAFPVVKVPIDVQKCGIDRVVQDPSGYYAVEYKTDLLAHKTNNLYVETASCLKPYKPGWATSSLASIIYYYVPQGGYMYCLCPKLLRRHLLTSEVSPYRTVVVKNERHSGSGLLVPISSAEKYFSNGWVDMPSIKNDDEAKEYLSSLE